METTGASEKKQRLLVRGRRSGKVTNPSHYLWNGPQERAVSPVPKGCTSFPGVHSSRCWLYLPFLLACQYRVLDFASCLLLQREGDMTGNSDGKVLSDNRNGSSVELGFGGHIPHSPHQGFCCLTSNILIVLARGGKWVCMPLRDGVGSYPQSVVFC